jgi:putative ABC transport system substrate-binding protein
MDRRAFIGTLLGGLIAAPLGTAAQPAGKVYRIAVLANVFDPQLNDVFQQSLRELGWVEGRNIIFERRYSEGRNDRFPVLARELVRLQPDVMITSGTPATAAAKEATTTIPIIFAAVGDPVGSGLIASLARPGGNLTGLGSTGAGLHAKLVEFLNESIPRLSRVAVFVNSTFPLHTSVYRPEVEVAARSLNLTLTHVEVRTPEDLDGAFATITREKLGALVVLGQPLMFVFRARVAKLALDHRVATAIGWREAVEAGALMSYGELAIDYQRRLPYYVDRILKGARPADLPVGQPTKFYLTINMKTAKALGLTIPQSLLQRADQVIE